ncbi:MAG: hypothetical protein M3Z66_23015 [Chloroflexota bacterium]|nr:hypothetical protein [Chloroflexota bacterium]
MRRIPTALFLITSTLLFAPHAVAARTPGARTLLGTAAATTLAAGTYHITSVWTVSVPAKLRSITHSHGDVATQPLEAHLYLDIDTSQLDGETPQPGTQREQQVVVGATVAVGGKGRSWNCAVLQDPGKVLGTLLPGSNSPVRVSYGPVTAGMLGSVPVWRVREFDSVPGGTQRATIDYFISQAESTLLRDVITERLALSNVPVTETLTHDYSRYGERIRIKLPLACAGRTR